MYYSVVAARVLRPYVLDVTFADGTRRQIDVEPELYGEMFELLRDSDLFEQATVDPELGTVVWPNGTDLSPEFLYASGTRGTVSAEAALASTDIPVQDQSIERDE